MTNSEMVKQETVRRLSGEPEFKLSAEKKIDNRRERTYSRELRVSFSLKLPVFEDAGTRSDTQHAVRLMPCEKRINELSLVAIAVAAREQLPARITMLSIVHTHRWRDYGDDGIMRYSLEYTFDAPKPSQIIEEQELIAWAHKHVVPVLHTAIRTATAEAVEKERRVEAARHAEHLADWAAKRVMERARSATRYEQRLAALKAELEAELAVQAAKFREDGELEGAVQWSDESFEPEGVDYAVKHFHERFRGWDTPFFHAERWSVDDLFSNTVSDED